MVWFLLVLHRGYQTTLDKSSLNSKLMIVMIQTKLKKPNTNKMFRMANAKYQMPWEGQLGSYQLINHHLLWTPLKIVSFKIERHKFVGVCEVMPGQMCQMYEIKILATRNCTTVKDLVRLKSCLPMVPM